MILRLFCALALVVTPSTPAQEAPVPPADTKRVLKFHRPHQVGDTYRYTADVSQSRTMDVIADDQRHDMGIGVHHRQAGIGQDRLGQPRLALLVAVTGVSGAGKSTLVNDVLYPALARKYHAATRRVGLHTALSGTGQLDKVISIDQSPIGRTPRSNPVTYVKVFDEIRSFFAQLP